NAVEAANKASGWHSLTPHSRAQILYFIAENLETRSEEFENRIMRLTGLNKKQAAQEVQTSVSRIFTYAALADKHEGLVHQPPMRGLALALNEPIGVMGIICPDEAPLLGLLSLLLPALAMGNSVVLIPSRPFALVATDFYQVLDTSDVPAGAINLVTGSKDLLARVLAEHDDVDAVWYAGHADLAEIIERLSIGNLKQTWVMAGRRNWADPALGEGREFLRRATQVKN
ncbi:MAG: aldehyde dehydrogenase family protein, partial [Acidobacteriota bacterium]|nr:aldehyde dehydrogenase family protein [Acidobacteriota bacterium]